MRLLNTALFVLLSFFAGVLAHRNCDWVQGMVGEENKGCVCRSGCDCEKCGCCECGPVDCGNACEVEKDACRQKCCNH